MLARAAINWWVFRDGGNRLGVSATALRFFRDLQHKAWAEAHGQLSSTLQQRVSAEALVAAWQGYVADHGAIQPSLNPFTGKPSATNFLSADATELVVSAVNGVATATLPVALCFAAGGPQRETLRFVHEGVSWRLAELPTFLTHAEEAAKHPR
jgi:hypothetical protein